MSLICVFISGNINVTQCNNCTAGKYCKGSGNPKPTGDCDKGFYCPPGQVVPNPNDFICPEGHFCTNGSQSPKPCVSGTYQDERMMDSCKVGWLGFLVRGGSFIWTLDYWPQKIFLRNYFKLQKRPVAKCQEINWPCILCCRVWH